MCVRERVRGAKTKLKIVIKKRNDTRKRINKATNDSQHLGEREGELWAGEEEETED